MHGRVLKYKTTKTSSIISVPPVNSAVLSVFYMVLCNCTMYQLYSPQEEQAVLGIFLGQLSVLASILRLSVFLNSFILKFISNSSLE